MLTSGISFFALLQDTQDPNPLIRALAVRTMGCIRVDKITEYLCDPLQRCLKVSRGLRGRRHACSRSLCDSAYSRMHDAQ